MDIEKRKNFLVNTAYFGIIFLAVFAIFRYFMPMVTPFAVAFVIAYLLKRPIRFLREGLKLPGRLSAILVVVLFYGLAGAILSVVGIKLVSAVVALIGLLPKMYTTHAQPFLMDILANIEQIIAEMDPSLVGTLSEVGTRMILSVGELVSTTSVRVMAVATDVATAVPGFFIKFVLMLISSFFIAADYERLTGFCLRQLGDRGKEVFFQIKEYIAGTLLVCIRSYILIMSITFVEMSIGLTLVKINHAVLLAFCVSIFDILPVLGTGGIMIPWAILTAIRGDYRMALSLLVVYVVITVIRNIIEPKIVGSQLGLHPVVTLCSMFVGAQLFGVVGMFGFPICLSLLRHLNDHGVIRLFR